MLTSFDNPFTPTPPKKVIDAKIYSDCTWILEKATFLKDENAVLSKVSIAEEQVRRNLRYYLEKWKMDEFFILLEQTVMTWYTMLFSIEKPSPNDVLSNPYKNLIAKYDELLGEIKAAHWKWYSEQYSLLWSNKTRVAMAVQDIFLKWDTVHTFWE